MVRADDRKDVGGEEKAHVVVVAGENDVAMNDSSATINVMEEEGWSVAMVVIISKIPIKCSFVRVYVKFCFVLFCFVLFCFVLFCFAVVMRETDSHQV